LNELITKLKEYLDLEVDKIRIYMVCEACRGKMEVIGQGLKMGDQDAIKCRGWVV
jgi:CRISPR/Cas system-associated endoribonuclease Cas2